jgi:hypothetical protein
MESPNQPPLREVFLFFKYIIINYDTGEKLCLKINLTKKKN